MTTNFDMQMNAKTNIQAVFSKLKSSGVFKGRRARHLPRVPPSWGPLLRSYAH